MLLPLVHGATSVFGHKAPDTDTVCSAIAYAWELNESGHEAKAFVLGDLTPETAFVLKSFGITVPPLLPALEKKAQVAIVDTSNPAELPDDLSNAKIHSIIDHHKLSGLTNSEPLMIDMRPLCSAAGIVYARAKSASRVPPKDVAGCMLAGILSDSLVFRSPTTTEFDKGLAKELAALAEVDLHKFGSEMLAEKGKIDHLTAEELIRMDSKIFKLGGKKLRVSVLETTSPASPMSKFKELVEAQKKIQADEKLDAVMFFIVDILEEVATYVSSSEFGDNLIEHAFRTQVKHGVAMLEGVLSRKKQIIPKFEAALGNTEL